MIFIVFSKFIIDKYANAINLILPFLQFLIAFIHFLDKIFPADSDEEYFEWYSGFSACYFHMGILIFLFQLFLFRATYGGLKHL